MKNVYFFTGASSQIAVETLKMLLSDGKKGDQFILHAFANSTSLEELQRLYPDAAIEIICTNLADNDAVSKLLDDLSDRDEPITHWIHCPAPKLHYAKLAKTAPDEFDLNLQVQVRSAFKIARVILPQMAKNRSGKVVFVLSSCVLEPVKFLTSYQTAKFALLGLMHSLSAEFAEKSVCVNAVAPAMMDTQFLSEVPDLIKELERQKASTKELLSASDTAKNIKMLLADDAPNGIIQPVSVI